MEQAKLNMLTGQIQASGVTDKILLELIHKMPRDRFVPKQYQELAYADLAIPLPGGQSMLCPQVEALLLQNMYVNKTDKVLEIGTGSGYMTALLAKLASFIYSIELDPINKEFAVNNLSNAGIHNVSILADNGINGLASHAPFNKILLNGSLTNLPQTLKNQLTIGGILIALVGIRPIVHALQITRVSDTEFAEKVLFETDAPYLINVLNGSHTNEHSFKF